MDCYTNDASDQCTYLRNNKITDQSAAWSEDYGVNWHGCVHKICRDKSPDYADCIEGCSLPILKVSLAILAILAWIMWKNIYYTF